MAKTPAKKGPGNIFGMDPAKAQALVESLTPREKQVAEMIAMGVPQKDIAKKLGIGYQTLMQMKLREALEREELDARVAAIEAKLRRRA